jgi:hypothetical protein
VSRTTSGHLVIADISGYTLYLTSSELEHAHEVLSSLMGLLVDRTLPPMRVAGLEGDAVFSYGIAEGGIGGQALIEMIEVTYVSFRRAIEQMVLNTTCQCNACANIGTLDLKFFVHYGTFSMSPLLGRDELVGSPVIEIHRLLKNRVAEVTGIDAYTAYTSQAVEALGLDGFTEGLVRHEETYPDLAPITLWVQDMHAVWETNQDGPEARIAPADTLLQVEGELPVPHGVVWELLLQPRYRSLLYGVDRQEPSQRQAGRIAEGSVFTCYHGKNTVTTQTVLALAPFKYIVTHDTTPIPGASIIAQIDIEPHGNSTAVTLTCSRARGPWISRSINNLIGPTLIARRLRHGLNALRSEIEQEIAHGTLEITETNPTATTDIEAAVPDSLPPPDNE